MRQRLQAGNKTDESMRAGFIIVAEHTLLPEVEQWIETYIPRDYRWPGNYRELEQCVRNIVIRRSYRPLEQHRRTRKKTFFLTTSRRDA
jgi:transcriptional regulator with GAF, ATPase, and Fis domain